MPEAPAPSLDPSLFAASPNDYPDKYADLLIEQYKLYVQSHEKISERREGANRFFVTLNSAAVAAIAFLWKPEGRSEALIICTCIAAAAICWFWYRAIRSYDNLNTGKFKVIHAVERRLPLALYESEWIALGEGRNPKLYKPISHLERSIPLVFGTLYFVIAGRELLALL